jgi:predicted DNA binding CopG/RHH family protein
MSARKPPGGTNTESAVEADLRAAMREKTSLPLQDVLATAAQDKRLTPVTIRLAEEDIESARRLAMDEGIGYQTYIKLLQHKALRKEAARASRTH